MLSVLNLSAQGDKNSLRFLWQRDFETDPNVNSSLGAICYDKSEHTLFLLGTLYTLKKGNSPEGKFFLYQMKEDGSKIKNLFFDEVRDDTAKTMVMLLNKPALFIKGLEILPNDNIVSIGPFQSNQLSIMKSTRQLSNVTFIPLFAEKLQKTETEIFKMAILENDILVIGHEGGVGLIARLTNDGKIIWKKKYNPGKNVFFTDIFVNENNGTFIVAGSSIPIDGKSFFTHESEIWILLYDLKGNILSEKIFPGRTPQICCVSPKRYIILYDKTNELMDENFFFKVLREDLTELFEKQFVSRKRFAKPFMVQPLENGHFIAAGYIKIGTVGTIAFYEFDENGIQQGYLEIVQKYLLPNTLVFKCFKNKVFFCFHVREEGNTKMKFAIIELAT